MIQTTIGDLLDNALDNLDTTDHHLYVVRDGDVVFYVGRSRDVEDRLLSHMGKGWWGWSQGKSSLGQLIEDNHPESLNWQIELLTPGDCGLKPLISKGITKEEWERKRDTFAPEAQSFFSFFPWDEDMAEDRPWYDDAKIRQAEELLIAQNRPCLNVTYNQDPGELPERYKRQKPDLVITVSDLVPW